LIPALRSIAVKRSAGIFEWPMVKRSNAVMSLLNVTPGSLREAPIGRGAEKFCKEIRLAVTALQALGDTY
jgi:hypothetical protein